MIAHSKLFFIRASITNIFQQSLPGFLDFYQPHIWEGGFRDKDRHDSTAGTVSQVIGESISNHS